jgi:2-polyprenyl-6-hydroxyphenyl methylase/3-demethylubiquinone-9 3-methyltransferase
VYDFSCCKLCATNSASPTYELQNTTVYTCAACGFHFINHLDIMPSASPGDETKYLDQKSADYIEARLGANGKQLRKNLLLVKKHCTLAGAHCLDIGAGVGLFAALLAGEGALVHGIEPQNIFREFAQKKFAIQLNGETIDDQHWQQGFAGFFDVVTLWDVLEHVNFPGETLLDAYRVTRPGGWLFLDTPRRDSLFYRISEWSYRLSGGSNPLFLQSLYSPQPFRHKQLFTRQQLLRLVEKIGFSVTRLNSPFLRPQNKMVIVCRKPDDAL